MGSFDENVGVGVGFKFDCNVHVQYTVTIERLRVVDRGGFTYHEIVPARFVVLSRLLLENTMDSYSPYHSVWLKPSKAKDKGPKDSGCLLFI
jgi:hypothetical protein